MGSLLDLRHLQTLAAIRDCGTMAAAAARLHLTQSALSHQIKTLEAAYGGSLFSRKSRPLRLSPLGQRLLDLADEVLPLVRAAERDLARIAQGRGGRLYITLDCHSCVDWLMPAMDAYRSHWPEVEMDLTLGYSFDPLPALAQGQVDLVITSDPVAMAGIAYQPLFRFQFLAVMASGHALAGRDRIEAGDLAGETLITYPVDRARLDVYRLFLEPRGVEPAGRRSAELTSMILQLVANGRGLAVLPAWAIDKFLARDYVSARPLGPEGLWATLHAALRSEDAERPYLLDFIATARETCFQTLTHIAPVAA